MLTSWQCKFFSIYRKIHVPLHWPSFFFFFFFFPKCIWKFKTTTNKIIHLFPPSSPSSVFIVIAVSIISSFTVSQIIDQCLSSRASIAAARWLISFCAECTCYRRGERQEASPRSCKTSRSCCQLVRDSEHKEWAEICPQSWAVVGRSRWVREVLSMALGKARWSRQIFMPKDGFPIISKILESHPIFQR